MKHVWYVTGGIGSGKSTVIKEFKKRGIACYSADEMSRVVRERRADEIAKVMGTTKPQELRQLIFDFPEKRRQLEDLVVPHVRHMMAAAIAESVASVVVAEIAPLYSRPGSDKVLTVEAPLHERIRRVMERDQCGEEQVIKIICCQPSYQERMNITDIVMHNVGGSEALAAQAGTIAQMMLLWSASRSV
jgi:dephospho-CoA kinase